MFVAMRCEILALLIVFDAVHNQFATGIDNVFNISTAELSQDIREGLLVPIFNPIPPDGCSADQFHCHDGSQCVPQKWVCDHDADCNDASDEPDTCEPPTCSSEHFQCKLTGLCLPKGYKCDREPDCGTTADGRVDTSDEDDNCNVTIRCAANEHKCLTTSQCFHLNKFCNTIVDCNDGSDEGPFCNETQKGASEVCKYGHSLTYEGRFCFCSIGQKYNRTLKACQDENECLRVVDGGIPVCEQICTDFNYSSAHGGFTCNCTEGYKKLNDTKCLAINDPQTLDVSFLVVTDNQIHHFDSSFTNRLASLDHPGWSLRALDIDHRNSRICWLDSFDAHHVHVHYRILKCMQVLQNSSFHQQSQTIMSAEFRLDGVVQMSYDWVTGNWYFLDDSFDRIFVCTKHLSICKALYSGIVEKPNDMAIDPSKGYLFVTDWATRRPSLWRLKLDGKESYSLVEGGIIHPYGVTLDYPSSTVYWLDSYLEYIHAIDYQGNNRKRHVANHHFIKSFLSLTLHNENLYATDPHFSRVVMVDKFGGHMNATPSNSKFQKINTIRTYHRQRQPTVIHPCGTGNGGCDHLCLISYSEKGEGQATCVCQDGFSLQNGNECVLKKPDKFLIFGKTFPGTIEAIGLDETALAGLESEFVIPPIRHLLRPAALDLKMDTNEVFYSDSGNYTVLKTSLSVENKRKITTVIHEGLSNCEGLAYDWVAKNLYWSDESFRTINVLSIRNTSWNVTIADTNLFHPRAIALFPSKGYIFWTDWADTVDMSSSSTTDKAKIERANLDGSGRIVLVEKSVHWPNGITLDYADEWLYWCDAYLDRIERIKLDGTDRQMIYSGDGIFHPYGITLVKDSDTNEQYIYWTEFRMQHIRRVLIGEDGKVVQGHTAEVYYNATAPLFDLRYYHKELQTGQTNPCAISNGGCDQLCFYVEEKVKCNCSNGYTMQNNKCTVDNSYTGRKHCMDGQFECRRNHRCIDMGYTCDGDDDCGDGTDEDNRVISNGICANKTCDAGFYKCSDNKCISEAWRCDGDADCRDGDDENNCSSKTPCGKDEFHCAVTGKCIPEIWLCDRDFDCGPGDNSDEHHNCSYPACTATEFECLNKQCVSILSLCDGDDDCKDGSDERVCDKHCLQGKEFSCEDSGSCLSNLYMCDGYVDCPNGKDEKDCPNIRGCTSNQFQCTDGECIRSLFECDGENDCIDGSDEKNCSGLICNKETHIACADNSKCYNKYSKCDGFDDCQDKSDEANCTSFTLREEKCTGPNWICHNVTMSNKNPAQCLSITKFCDGTKDCNDPVDEGPECLHDHCKIGANVCDHSCHSTLNGFGCLCRPGYTSEDGRACKKDNPCEKWGVCSQNCHPTGTHYYCDCVKGYTLLSNKFTCKSTAEDKPVLIFSNRHELRLLGLRDTSVSRALASNLKNSIAIDFLYNHNQSHIFWTDIADDKIYKATVQQNGLTDIKPIVEHGIVTAEGIAVDWLGLNLFWVDSSLDQIEVAKLDGSHRTTVVKGNMQNLRALAVDPRKGLMFWTDWFEMEPRLERCTLAGNGRRVIFRVLNVPGGGWPNGLTVDYAQQRLYWIDAKSDSIHTIDYDGHDHHQVLRADNFLSHPYAITIFEDHVYWTDWRVNSIVRANKWNGTSVKLVQGTSAQPFDLQVLHSSRQPTITKNPCYLNGNCSHFCLIDYTIPPKNRVCLCPYLMKSNADGLSCSDVEEAVIFSEPMAIAGVETTEPYNNYMPVVTNAYVENVTALDVHVQKKILVWADSKTNVIIRAFTNGSYPTVLVDAAIDHPSVAVDWLHDNVYFTSWTDGPDYYSDRATIQVVNLEGQFRSVLRSSADGLNRPTNIVLDPVHGRMFWIDFDKSKNHWLICTAEMNGGHMKQLTFVPNATETNPKSLFYCQENDALYWTNEGRVFWIKLDNTENKVESMELDHEEQEETMLNLISIANNWLYYFVQSNNETLFSYIGKIQLTKDDFKTTGQEIRIRNTSSLVTNLKVIAPDIQKGESECASNNCPHLCVPTSTHAVCICASGFEYKESEMNPCVAQSPFLLYADDYMITGRCLNDTLNKVLLPPISGVHKPLDVDFHASNGLIFFTDGDTNKVYSVNRDLTERRVVLSDDTVKVGSIAVDYIADNIYWTSVSGKADANSVIEVATLDGQHRTIIVAQQTLIQSLHVDPTKGYLFWRNATGIQRAYLDGSARKTIVNDSSIRDMTIERNAGKLCWLIGINSTFVCSDYDGSNRKTVHHMANNMSHFKHIALHNRNMYWFDKKNQRGSIVTAEFLDDGTLQPVHYLKTINMRSDIAQLMVYDQSSQPQSTQNKCSVTQNRGGCQHLCLYRGVNEKQPYVCRCSFSELAADARSCVDHSAFLAYSQSKSIEFAGVTENLDENAPYPPFADPQYVQNVVGLAFDIQSERLFFSDIQQGHIMTIYYKGNTTKERRPTVVASDLGSVEGLAFDHLHNDLYWTSYSNGTISRATVRSSTVLPVSPNIVLKMGANDKPRGIALDPCNKRMYWTDWNEATPRIERAYMSGADRQTIIATKIKTPNALAIDFNANKLYWADARLDKVEMCDLDGRNRMVLASTAVSHPFGLVIYADYIYWTDWLNRAVMRANKYTGGDVTFIRKDFTRQPMGIVAVTRQLTKCMVDACSDLNLGCQDKCTTNADGTAFCICFEGRILNADGRTCTDPKSRCSPVEFECSVSERCIPIESVCDAHNDCPRGDDERAEFCESRKCPDGYFKCPSGQCIPEAKRCDSINHCGLHEDEVQCECDKWNQFTCTSGMCIPKAYKCDFKKDCNDASDEMNCPPRNCSAKTLLGQTMKNCDGTTQCYISEWVCDGMNDCWNNFDETNCPPVADAVGGSRCLSSMFKCKSPRNSPQCIPRTWRCDTEPDCEDASDEQDCHEAVHCHPDHDFSCADNSRCIPKTWKCDDSPDCNDGSDEKDCPALPNFCKDGFHFLCKNSSGCVSNLWLCDGSDDCLDGSDEHNCTKSICRPNQFECANGKCVHNEFYCDADDDCGDNSDEPKDCEPRTCNIDEFECVDKGNCIPVSWKCNGIADCADKSDEQLEICDPLVYCKSTQFTCANKVCLDSDTLVCNSVNDCGDWSDEIDCNQNECLLSAPCEHVCNNMKIGYNCSCFYGYQLAQDKHSCIDRDECALDLPCSQRCVNRPGGFDCQCASGYMLEPDQKSCKHADTVAPYLLFTNRHFLWKYKMESKESRAVLENLTNAVAVDFDIKTNTAFFSDVTLTSSSIASISLNGTPDSIKKFDDLTVRNPDGLAVDWVGRNIYWCDKTTDSIEVANIEGKFRKTLLKGPPLHEPRAIVLDPFMKYLFYTDWGSAPHIGRMDMNGENLKILVNTSVKWPNALTIDLATKHIFWGDAGTHIIGMIDYEGGSRKVVKNSGVKHIFGMALFENWLYWTDWDEGKVMKCHKHTGENCTTLVFNLKHRPMGIKVVHPLVQSKPPTFGNPCFMNGFCSKLCLLTPNQKNGHACACPNDFKLHGSLECKSDCKPSEFVCEHTGKCLPIWWRCDGQNDCGDWQDEMYQKEGACPPYPCTQGQFLCAAPASQTKNASHCIHPSKLCDGVRDCPMNDDEGNATNIIDCLTYECLKSQYKCINSKRCIAKSQKCDGFVDCEHEDDEKDCPAKECPDKTNYLCVESERCIPKVWICDGTDDCPKGDDEHQNCTRESCSTYEFECTSSGKCVQSLFVCDGVDDCLDSSDELHIFCSSRVCSGKQFHCTSTGRCIPESWKCDGDADCGDGEDELSCVDFGKNCTGTEHFTCTSDQTCVALRYRCDGENDCNDGSDELDCDTVDKNMCRDEEWMCADGTRCIANDNVCDLLPDCLDESDEYPKNADCPATPVGCGPNQFQCNTTGNCIPAVWKCDGTPECPDLTDEIGCEKVCDKNEFRCKTGLCISKLWLCDQVPDCGLNDTSDQDPAMCKLRACLPSQMKCRDGTCYPSHLHCDGVIQCKDGSDEHNDICENKCEFLCQNGHCVEKKYKCNGLDDCGDNTDEIGCPEGVCDVFGLCPRWCMQSKKGKHKCYCGDGYQQETSTTHTKCKVKGDAPPLLVIAGKSEIRLINPQTRSHYKTIKMNESSINSMDFLKYKDHMLLIWTDGRRRAIRSMKLPENGKPSRPKRGAVEDGVQVEEPYKINDIAQNLHQPHGLAVDWVNQNIYVADSVDQSIMVIRLDGNVRKRLVHKNLYDPRGVAVDPYHQLVFWTDVGLVAKIESSNLNGDNRKTLAKDNLITPTDITVDSANARLYWVDPRAGVLETMTIYGTDRRVVKSYGYDSIGGLLHDRPCQLDVFEDSVYVGGMPYFSAWKESKWGNSSAVTSLVRQTHALPQAPVILMVHANRQFAVTSPCKDEKTKCYKPAMCIPKSLDPKNVEKSGSVVECLCRNGLVYNSTAKTCVLASKTNPECSLDCGERGLCQRSSLSMLEDFCLCEAGFSGKMCQIEDCDNLCLNGGTCVHNEQRGIATCDCPKEFDGPRCERYKCMNRCKNGMCYIDAESGYPQCQCQPGYSGDSCALSDELCGKCYNGGTCRKIIGNFSMCTCVDGYSGIHCQNCYDKHRQRVTHICHNGAYCQDDQCHCPFGYSGPHCSIDFCDGHCYNGGTCEHGSGRLICSCPVAFGGERCERDLCHMHCLNGGSCKHTDFGKQTAEDKDFVGTAQCFCPPQYTGERCEVPQSCRDYCGANGNCIDQAKYTCSCVNDYTGPQCSMPTRCRHFCDNAANCTLDAFGDPQCVCSPGLGGDRCNKVTGGSCHELLCYNDGKCYEQLVSEGPACRCTVGWTGLACTLPTCNQYCLNGATCTQHSGRTWCACPPQWMGDRCEIKNHLYAQENTSHSSTIASVVLPLIVVIVLALAIFYVIFVRRKRVSNQFKHSRMDELEEEMVNPVFMHGEDDEELANEATNFTNPMYDSVYKNTVISAPSDQEQQGLLHKARLEIQPEDT